MFALKSFWHPQNKVSDHSSQVVLGLRQNSQLTFTNRLDWSKVVSHDLLLAQCL